jgi:hypothetical protein
MSDNNHEESDKKHEDRKRARRKVRGGAPSQLIDVKIKELSDCGGETFARVRILIKDADPEVVEEWKWRGVRCVAHRNDLHW